MDSLEDRLAAALGPFEKAYAALNLKYGMEHSGGWLDFQGTNIGIDVSALRAASTALAEYRVSKEPCTAGPDGGPCVHYNLACDCGCDHEHPHNRGHCGGGTA